MYPNLPVGADLAIQRQAADVTQSVHAQNNYEVLKIDETPLRQAMARRG